MTTGANWSALGTSDTLATFGYELLGGRHSRSAQFSWWRCATGLKMEANLTTGTVESLAIPNGVRPHRPVPDAG